MQNLAVLLGMGDNTRHWSWRYYAYLMLAILHTITAEEGAKEKQMAEDALKKATKMLEKPSNVPSVGLLKSSGRNDLVPFVPPVVTAFYLWSKDYKKGKEYQRILPSDPKAVNDLNFLVKKTFIIIHGFLGDGLEDWIQTLKDKLLNSEDCNVISVDWPAGNSYWLPSYYTAVGRVPFVGMDTAALLNDLHIYKGLDMSSVHLIGHSLGAHASGFCGKFTSLFMNKKISRISGLDPAGLMFHAVLSESRLDKSDASYVDVMHTNGCYAYWAPWTDCFGINENLGHTDFWPNGGEYQPVCRKAKKELSAQQGSDNQTSNQAGMNATGMSGVISGEIGCDHEMAYVYFLESIDYSTDGTYYLARPCQNWTSYTDGLCSCGEYAQYMGFNSFQGINGVFFLSTNTKTPFGLRDASCASAWSHTRYIIILLSSSTSAAVLAVLLIATAVYCVVKKTRRKDESLSGLVVETDDENADYDNGSACSI